jgi:hypothetical protein
MRAPTTPRRLICRRQEQSVELRFFLLGLMVALTPSVLFLAWLALIAPLDEEE